MRQIAAQVFAASIAVLAAVSDANLLAQGQRGAARADLEIESLVRQAEKNQISGEAFDKRLQVLIDRSDADSVRLLIDLLGDPRRNEGARAVAASVLGHMKASSAIPGLTIATRDEHATVRATALQGLMLLNAPNASSALIGGLADKDATVRGAAVTFIGELRDPTNIDALVRTLDDPDILVRVAVTETLALLGPASAPKVSAALPGLSKAGQLEAVRVLAKLKDPSGAEVLAQLLGSLSQNLFSDQANAHLANEAQAALVQLGTSSIAPLGSLLQSPDRDVRDRAIDALGDLRSPSAVALILRSITMYEDETTAVQAIARAEEHAIAPLLEALKGDRIPAICTAIYALGYMRASSATEPLRAALQWERARKQGGLWSCWGERQAVYALGQLGVDAATVPQPTEFSYSVSDDCRSHSSGIAPPSTPLDDGNAGATLSAAVESQKRIDREFDRYVQSLKCIDERFAPADRAHVQLTQAVDAALLNFSQK